MINRVKDFIFIAGAPGSGKSIVAKKMQQKLDCPLFEFGWIPEFRNTGEKILTYSEEEVLAFENIVLVAKNYAKHGFKNVVITDLNNDYIRQLPELFSDYNFAIYTLRLEDENVLKERVLDKSRSSEYRDWRKAQEINRQLQNRQPLKNETFLDITTQSVDEVAEQIIASLN